MKKIMFITSITIAFFVISLGMVSSGNILGRAEPRSDNTASTALSFFITMNKTDYRMYGPVNITVHLRNIGNTSMNVSEINLALRTLDFQILTPEGYVIHYIGPCISTPARGVRLNPREEYVTDTDLRFWMWSWGNKELGNYNLTRKGEYTIKAIYTSDRSLCFDNTIWEGTLYSNTLNFSIDDVVINEFVLNTTDPLARWIELYNPTDRPINLSGWFFSFSGVYTLRYLPDITIQPKGYGVFVSSSSIVNFTRYWKVSDLNIYELSPDIIPSYHILLRCPPDGEVVDYTWSGAPYDRNLYLTTTLNHSYARYIGGYDTDDFTNDFYDEPYPTPGYENHWEKPELSITHSKESRNVTLCWNNTGNSEIWKYNLLLSSLPSFSSNSTTTIEISDKNTPLYEFTNLSNGKYYFKLLAYNSTGVYAESNTVEVTINIQSPSPPTNLITTLTDSKVKLTWNPPINDGNATITEYRIYRGTSSDPLKLIASVNGSVMEYIDSNVSKGKTYYYSVSAVNQIGESNLSEVVSIEIPKEKENGIPSLDLVWVIGAMAFIMIINHRRKKRNDG